MTSSNEQERRQVEDYIRQRRALFTASLIAIVIGVGGATIEGFGAGGTYLTPERPYMLEILLLGALLYLLLRFRQARLPYKKKMRERLELVLPNKRLFQRTAERIFLEMGSKTFDYSGVSVKLTRPSSFHYFSEPEGGQQQTEDIDVPLRRFWLPYSLAYIRISIQEKDFTEFTLPYLIGIAGILSLASRWLIIW